MWLLLPISFIEQFIFKENFMLLIMCLFIFLSLWLHCCHLSQNNCGFPSNIERFELNNN